MTKKELGELAAETVRALRIPRDDGAHKETILKMMEALHIEDETLPVRFMPVLIINAAFANTSLLYALWMYLTRYTSRELQEIALIVSYIGIDMLPLNSNDVRRLNNSVSLMQRLSRPEIDLGDLDSKK